MRLGDRVRELLAPPSSGDPDRDRRARLLYRALLVTFPILIGLTVLMLVGDPDLSAILYIAETLIVLLVLVLLRQGSFMLATVLFLAATWLLSTINAVDSGGLGTSAIGAYAVMVLLAGFFWRTQAAFGCIVLALASMIGVAVLSPNPAYQGLAAVRYIAEVGAQLVAVTVVLYFALRLISQAADDEHEAEIAEIARRTQLELQLHEASKFEALGRLAGGVAHDFNNLLTAIIGNVELLELSAGKLEPEDAELLANLKDAVDRAALLTGKLLAVGRRQALSQTEVEVDALVRDMQQLLQSLVKAQNNLVLALDAQGERVRCDPAQLERVILNLVANARDAMPEGGTVTLSSHREGFDVHLCVADTGTGMSDEVIARVFEPFFSTKGEAGTGLGLATAHGIVTQSGGRIEIDSLLGAGTRVDVILPCVDSVAGITASGSFRVRREPQHVPSSAGILLIDADPSIRQLCAGRLERAGYRVWAVADAEEARAQLRERDAPLALLIADIAAPARHGERLAWELRADRPELPVILMSGFHDSLAETDDPTVRFLPKPFSAEKLEALVERMIHVDQ